jgi:hypothetical protein
LAGVSFAGLVPAPPGGLTIKNKKLVARQALSPFSIVLYKDAGTSPARVKFKKSRFSVISQVGSNQYLQQIKITLSGN